jgi:hypothetical protein
MKVAIMQPYFFPYIGYFQLVASSDTFVFLDNVQYINRGWINRNYVLSNGKAKLISIPLKNAPRHMWIKNREISPVEYKKTLVKVNKMLQACYSKSEYYLDIQPLVMQVLNENDQSISQLAENSIKKVCDYLGVKKQFCHASKIITDHESSNLNGTERIAKIVDELGGTEYINPASGQELYAKDWFMSKGIKIYFMTPHIQSYPQGTSEFVPSLSIIDVLMNNSIEQIREMLYGKPGITG